MRNPGTPPLITVFGGSGFIGRYVCEALMKSGARLRVAERDPRRGLVPAAARSVGQVSIDRRRPCASRDGRPRGRRAPTRSINLVGMFKGNLELVHVDGAGRLAAAAKSAGAAAFVHVSAIGADINSASEYGRTKGQGEQAVRAAFPNATIIRPSVVFGPEDDFTNRFACNGAIALLPVIAPKTRFQPVYVRDLGRRDRCGGAQFQKAWRQDL